MTMCEMNDFLFRGVIKRIYNDQNLEAKVVPSAKVPQLPNSRYLENSHVAVESHELKAIGGSPCHK